jgi:acyl carrier protein
MKVTERVREIVLEFAPNPMSLDLIAEAHLVADLQFHSLALVELVYALEDEFDLGPIGADDVEDVRTCGDIERFIECRTSKVHADEP